MSFAIYGLPQHNSRPTKSLCRICFNLWLEPTQQQRHQNVLQDLILQFMACTNSTADPPKVSAGFTQQQSNQTIKSNLN
jgi:hypothetical protein